MSIEQRHQGGRGRGTEPDDDASACALAMKCRVDYSKAEKGGAFTAIRHLKKKKKKFLYYNMHIRIRRIGRRTIPLDALCRAALHLSRVEEGYVIGAVR